MVEHLQLTQPQGLLLLLTAVVRGVVAECHRVGRARSVAEASPAARAVADVLEAVPNPKAEKDEECTSEGVQTRSDHPGVGWLG